MRELNYNMISRTSQFAHDYFYKLTRRQQKKISYMTYIHYREACFQKKQNPCHGFWENNTPNYVTYLKKEALMNASKKNNINKKKRLEILKANMLPVKLPKNAMNHFNLTNFKVGNVAYRVGHKINNKNFYMYFKPTSFKNWWGDPFNKNLNNNDPISNKPHVLTGKPILRKNVVKVKFF